MCRCSVPRGWDPGVIWPGHRRHSTLIFYLRFIPPSPWDEAGQDKRNPIQSLFLEDFLPAASGWWWRGQSTILHMHHPSWKLAHILLKSWLKTEQHKILSFFFQPCWAWIPFTVFPDRMYHHDLQSWDQSKKNVNLNRAQHILLEGVQDTIRATFGWRKEVMRIWSVMRTMMWFLLWSVLKFVLIHQ